MSKNFALPLFALVDRHKIDPDTSDLLGLAGQLGGYLTHNFSIQHQAVSIEGVQNATGAVDLYLLLAGVPQSSWAALLALADSQRSRIFLCDFADDATGRFTLTPLGQ